MMEDVDLLLDRMFKKRKVDERIEAFANGAKKEDAVPPPVVVHCSAGLGRTGTLCAAYNLVEALKFTKNPIIHEKL